MAVSGRRSLRSAIWAFSNCLIASPAVAAPCTAWPNQVRALSYSGVRICSLKPHAGYSPSPSSRQNHGTLPFITTSPV